MTNTTQKQWLTPQDLLQEYSISLKTQDRLRWKKLIPYSKVQRQVRYSRKRIDEWLENHEVA